jgi:hypothetical protein
MTPLKKVVRQQTVGGLSPIGAFFGDIVPGFALHSARSRTPSLSVLQLASYFRRVYNKVDHSALAPGKAASHLELDFVQS